jgi:hypothetical protein
MLADIKAVARRYREQIWNQGALNVADEIFAPTCAFHNFDPITPALEEGPAGAKKLVTSYRTAFPDARFTLDDVFAEGDRVLIRWTAQGTHTGSLMGIGPTRMKVTVHGMDVYRVAGSKIQEIWVNWDTMSFMQQLGLEPPSPATKSVS